jgi:hypothetical protein
MDYPINYFGRILRYLSTVISVVVVVVGLHPMTEVGSLWMCQDPDVVPPLAGFLHMAVLGVLHHILSVVSVCGLGKGTLVTTALPLNCVIDTSTVPFRKRFRNIRCLKLPVVTFVECKRNSMVP